MISTSIPSKSTQAAWLEQRIQKHREEVSRLRQQIGDPEEALSEFVRGRFERQAFVPDDLPASTPQGIMIWEDADDSDAW